MQINQMLAEIRVLLDEPNRQHPSERHLFTFLLHQLQHYHNELSNTGQNWDVASWQLNVSTDLEEYLLTAPNFGKPLFILTHSTDPDFVSREVPIWDIQNFDYPPSKSGAMPWLTENHSAVAMAFYGKGSLGARYVRVTPKPQLPVAYMIWYEVGPIPAMGLGSELLLPEHHHLICYRTALNALPACRWADFPPDLIAAKMQALQSMLTNQVAQYDEAFQRYKNNLREESMGPRVLFGENSDGWW